jgi:hypothetical protein
LASRNLKIKSEAIHHSEVRRIEVPAPLLYNILGDIREGGTMSRLIDELNRLARAVPQPMGFRTERPDSAENRILLIASLAKSEAADHLAGSVDGAHAVLLRLAKSGLAGSTLQKIAMSLPDIPWGGWLEDFSAKKMEALVKAGCDFVVFPATSRVLDTPQDDQVGKILQVEPSLGEGLLRAVNDMPVDAVLAADVCEAGEPVAWHHLMILQRLANLLSKPLLVTAPSNITASEIKALWEAGVDGVVVEATGQPGKLRELRQSIGKLTFRPSRKRGKAEALLPHIGGEKSEVTPDEEEEEFE